MTGFDVLAEPGAMRGLLDAMTDADWPDVDSHPLYGRFIRRLYPTVRPESRRDLSFAVLAGAAPRLVVPCTAGDGLLSCFGLPITFIFRADVGTDERHALAARAFEHIALAAPAAGAEHALLRGGAPSAPFPAVDAEAEARGAERIEVAHAIVDLTKSDDDLWRGVRKSFRQNVRWGRGHIRLAHVNESAFDAAACETYALFHAKVSGRVVHGPAYWAVIWEEIRAGRAELTLGRFDDGALVAGNIVTFAGRTAYYASGVYDRERFDKPLGHGPLYDSILRTRAKGATRFDLGEIPTPEQGANDKEVAIGHFKKGFTDTLETTVRWRWRP